MSSRLPVGWAYTTLGEVGEYLNGRAFKGSEWSHKGRPIIRIQDLTGTGKQPNRFAGEVPERYLVRRGDLLISWSATLGAYIWQGDEAVLNQHIFKVRSHIDIRFHYHLVTALLVDLLRQTHGSGMVHITKTRFEHTPIAIPALQEQRRIVAAIEEHLSHLDAAVAGLRRVQAQLPRFRAAVLKAAVEGRLVRRYADREGVVGRPPQLPPGWCWSSIAKLKAFSMYGPRFPREAYAHAGPLVLRTSDIGDGGRVNLATAPRIALVSDALERYRVVRGDLLVTRTGSLGTVALFDDQVDAIPGAYLIQFRLNAPLETSRYVFRFLQSPDGRRQLVRGGAGVGRPNLNAPTIEAIPIPLPPLSEQRAILAELDRELSVIESMSESTARQLRYVESMRQSILRRAFSGQLVPQDANEEPASVLLERIRAALETQRAHATSRVGERAGGRRRLPRRSRKG